MTVLRIALTYLGLSLAFVFLFWPVIADRINGRDGRLAPRWIRVLKLRYRQWRVNQIIRQEKQIAREKFEAELAEAERRAHEIILAAFNDEQVGAQQLPDYRAAADGRHVA